jgi:hypothetical protein
MKKKYYRKPLMEKVNLRVTESVLTACKLTIASIDANTGSTKHCTQGSPTLHCKETQGS